MIFGIGVVFVGIVCGIDAFFVVVDSVVVEIVVVSEAAAYFADYFSADLCFFHFDVCANHDGFQEG